MQGRISWALVPACCRNWLLHPCVFPISIGWYLFDVHPDTRLCGLLLIGLGKGWPGWFQCCNIDININTVGKTRFAQKFFGTGNILWTFNISTILVIRLYRRVTGNRGRSAHDKLDQFTTIRRHTNRLANTNVGKRSNISTEHQTAPIAGWHFHHFEFIVAGKHRLLLIGHLIFKMNLATKQGLQACLTITDADDFHVCNARRTFPVIHIGFKLCSASSVKFYQLKRASANA